MAFLVSFITMGRLSMFQPSFTAIAVPPLGSPPRSHRVMAPSSPTAQTPFPARAQISSNWKFVPDDSGSQVEPALEVRAIIPADPAIQPSEVSAKEIPSTGPAGSVSWVAHVVPPSVVLRTKPKLEESVKPKPPSQ